MFYRQINLIHHPVTDSSKRQAIPPAAIALGFGGLLPFAAGTLALVAGWHMPFWPKPDVALQAYGAVILSFLGGVRWGLALGVFEPRQQATALAISVLPSLAAWAALLLPSSMGLPVLIAAFLSLGIADLRIVDLGAPDWFRRLRILLSTGVVTLLAVALARIAFWQAPL